MATKVEAPGTGIELDASNLPETVRNIVIGIAATMVSLFVVGTALSLYQGLAGRTEAVQEVNLP